jgi:hypothetical protein
MRYPKVVSGQLLLRSFRPFHSFPQILHRVEFKIDAAKQLRSFAI